LSGQRRRIECQDDETAKGEGSEEQHELVGWRLAEATRKGKENPCGRQGRERTPTDASRGRYRPRKEYSRKEKGDERPQ
jgi:hypothetical protein